jgi:hypothetical protein
MSDLRARQERILARERENDGRIDGAILQRLANWLHAEAAFPLPALRWCRGYLSQCIYPQSDEDLQDCLADCRQQRPQWFRPAHPGRAPEAGPRGERA